MLVEQIKKRQVKLSVDWRFHVLVFIAAFSIVVSRRPDILFNPQFWAEDGTVWYAHAYNFGIAYSIFSPFNGYFQTISRLTAAVAQLFPLLWAPFIFNLIAIVIKILPVNVITSSRFSKLIPSLYTRLLLAVLYLALPNTIEVHANITNAHWYLAILACMVVLATPSRLPIWRTFDLGIILLSALSGPFSILLTPIAATTWWLRRHRWTFTLLLGTSVGALIQSAAILLTGHSNRVQTPLGATPELFAKILAGQVFLGALIGQRGYERICSPSREYYLIAILVAIAGVAVFIYGLLNAPMELRLFTTFAALVFGISLLSPMASGSTPQWQVLWLPGAGGRYWFIPMLGFITLLTWLPSAKNPRLLRTVAVFTLAIMVIGIQLDWRHPAFADFNFKNYATKFTAAPQGTKVMIPINPPGWMMELTKH